MNKIGLYIHVPFCKHKCPYCDFFSEKYNREKMDVYVQKVISEISLCPAQAVDTVYFGGGTPGLLGTDSLLSIMEAIHKKYGDFFSEVTLEINPENYSELDFSLLHKSGINRLSMGLQSANESELKYLSRLHSARMLEAAVDKAKLGGFDNISVDLMLGVSNQTHSSLKQSIKYCAELDIQHISAYILKIEEGTPYFEKREKFTFPNEDEQASLYLCAVEELEKYGFLQYEISNFCKDSMQSQHNLKYWNCEEYIGIGPSAHSFYKGKRFYTPRSFDDFYNNVVIYDGDGGDEEEYAMLRLRLSKGLCSADFEKRFSKPIPEPWIKKAQCLPGLCEASNDVIRLTKNGFLLSNSIIAKIIF